MLRNSNLLALAIMIVFAVLIFWISHYLDKRMKEKNDNS